uniref:Ig-like domain-containing protein n=1 Tax=Gopherus agassizii TaxID=38772 RepID=A0A452H5U9_9SAUR
MWNTTTLMGLSFRHSLVTHSTFHRDNRFEVFANGTLSVQNVNIQDRGQYLCIAANQHGSDQLLVTLSVVAYPPRILEGRSKVITVHSGKPIPTISWILEVTVYDRGLYTCMASNPAGADTLTVKLQQVEFSENTNL